jgi:hypothetical protein
VGELGATPRERYQKAARLVASHDIDLASAYSVLLGLWSAEQARSRMVSSGQGEQDRLRGDRKPRADRVVRASTLVREQGLPWRLAFEVAAGKLTLQEALRRKGDEAAPRPVASLALERRPSGRRRWLPVLIGLALGGAVLFLAGREEAGRPETPAIGSVDTGPPRGGGQAAPRTTDGSKRSADPLADRTETLLDEDGQITRVRGRSPVDILEAYCAATAGEDRCQPVRVELTAPVVRGVRIGVLQKVWEPGREYAIAIRRDEELSSWFAGTGLKPLQPEPLPR